MQRVTCSSANMKSISLLILAAVIVSSRTENPQPEGTLPLLITDLKKLCSNEEAELEYERGQFYELTKCLAQVLNATAFRQQILSMGTTSRVDEIVDKVCKKLPEIVECTSQYVSSIGPCMDAKQKREKELWKNLRQMNMEFACGIGRDHLIKFINEGGLQCIATHRTAISQCVNDKFPALLKQQSDTQIVKTLAIITQQPGKCNSLKEVEGCVNLELFKCMDPGSLSIIRQYFSSLDVLFACKNDTGENGMQPTQKLNETSVDTLNAIAQMEKESLQMMTRINDSLERLINASEHHTQIQESTEKKMANMLEQQTVMIEKMAHSLDGNVVQRLRKNSRRLHMTHTGE